MRLQIKYCLVLSCLVNYRHLGHHVFFYQELEIRLKQQEMEEILTCKITHKLAFCIILSTIFTFIVERSWKNMHFYSKMVWPPATYDLISHNHWNWSSLNLSQNACGGKTNSYWKRQVLMFYRLGKKTEKPQKGLIVDVTISCLSFVFSQ